MVESVAAAARAVLKQYEKRADIYEAFMFTASNFRAVMIFVRVEKIRSQQRIEQGRKNRGKTQRKVLLLTKVDSHVAVNWPREFVSLVNPNLSEAYS